MIPAVFLLFRADRFHSKEITACRKHGKGSQNAQFAVAEKLVIIDAEIGAASDQNAVGGAPVGDIDYCRDPQKRSCQYPVPFPAFVRKQDIGVKTDMEPGEHKKHRSGAGPEDQDERLLPKDWRLDMPDRMQGEERKA